MQWVLVKPSRDPRRMRIADRAHSPAADSLSLIAETRESAVRYSTNA
jgi:hypothetical protein